MVLSFISIAQTRGAVQEATISPQGHTMGQTRGACVHVVRLHDHYKDTICSFKYLLIKLSNIGHDNCVVSES